MVVTKLDEIDFSPEGKSAKELEALIEKFSQTLSALEDEEYSEETSAEALTIFERWRRSLGVDHPASLGISLALVRYLNDTNADEATTMAFGLAQTIQPKVERALGERHEQTLRGLLVFGELQVKYRQPEVSFRTLMKAMGLVEAEAAATGKTAVAIYGTLPAELHAMLGKLEVERSNAEEALDHFRKATELIREAPHSVAQKKLMVQFLVGYGHFSVESGALSDEEVLKVLLEAKDRAKEIVDEVPGDYFHVMGEVAEMYHRSGSPLKAVAELEEAVTLAEERFPPSHASVVMAKTNVASFVSQSYPERAEALLNEVLPHAEGSKLEGTILKCLADIYADTGRQKEAEALLNRCLVLARKFFGDLSEEVVDVLRSIAALLAATHRLEKAMGVLNHALALNEDVESGLSFNVFDLRELATKISIEMGHMADARAHAQAMLNLRLESVGRAHPLTGDVLFLQARIEVREDPSAALELIREALAILEEFYEGKPHQSTAEMLEVAAELMFDDEGEPEEAVKLQRKAVEMYQQLFEDNAPEAVVAKLTLAGFLRQGGQAEEAHAIATKVTQELKDTGSHLSMAMAFATLAEIDEDDPDSSLASFKKALAELQKMDRPHEMKVTVNHTLGQLYDSLGDTANAIAHQEAACVAARDMFGEDTPEEAEHLQVLAELSLANQETDKAIALLDRAQKIRLATNADEAEIADAHLVMAAALRGAGRLEETVAKYEEALELSAKLEDSDVTPKVLSTYGEFLLTSPGHEERGIELLEQAHPMFVALGDLQAIMATPLMLASKKPQDAIRWLPLFESAAEVLFAAETGAETHEELFGAFMRSLSEVRALVQGRATKAAS